MKQDWIWMPHAGHFFCSRWCRFKLNTYVNGYIVSTVGQYWPDAEVRRIFVENFMRFRRLEYDEKGKLFEKIILTEEGAKQLLDLKGDVFDDAYLNLFGYEDIGLDRKYETMVFEAKKQDEVGADCCPWKATGGCLDMEGYNSSEEAYHGHLEFCEQYDKEKSPE